MNSFFICIDINFEKAKVKKESEESTFKQKNFLKQGAENGYHLFTFKSE